MARASIIDTHVHFWDMANPDKGLAWTWLEKDYVHPVLGDTDAMKSVKYTVDSLWAEARFAEIRGFVHVQAALGAKDPVAETRWLTKMRQTSPVPFMVVGHADLGEPQARAQLAGHLESPYFVGIRDYATEGILAGGETNPDYEASLVFMAEKQLVLDIDCEWQNMSAALKMARRHPELQIVLEHIGYPRRRDDEYFTNWRQGITELAKAENVVCKISGVAMTDAHFTRDSLRPWVHSCLEAFGANRCVLGSNWPLDRLFSSYDVIMGLYRDYLAEQLSPDEQDKVFQRNAVLVYKFC